MRFIGFLSILITCLPSFAQNINISAKSGVYADAVSIEISGDFENVYYTTNGEQPTKYSKKYATPILIDENTFLQIKPVYKDNSIDTIIARTYIFNFETKLPIISIGVDNEDFWNDSTGIFTRGKQAYIDTLGHWTNANYHQNWEKKVHFIYLDTNKTEQVNQICGIKIFGESTRRLPDKSMKLIARKEYGKNRFNYRFFPQKDISEFKQLAIRTSGNDYKGTRFKDVLNTYLARNLKLDYMAFQPIQLFINGEYWGLYNLREKVNEHFLEENHGSDSDSTSIIMGRWIRQHGSSADYKKMYNWFLNLDTMDSAAYEKAKSFLDMRNYINYRAFQIFINNMDSRGNIRYWNDKGGDGKFRMILYDTDLSFGNSSHKFLEDCLSPVSTDWNNPPWSTMYLRKLIQNEQFKNDFVIQLAHLMNTCLHRDTIIEAVNHFENIYKDELPRDGSKLERHLRHVPIPMKEWQENVDELKMFAKLRPKKVRAEITRLLAPEGEFNLTIKSDTGRIKINENYALTLPFSGIYYKNIPLPVEAIDFDNWHFTHWSDGDTSTIKIIKTETDSLTIKPMYTYLEPKLTATENNIEKQSTSLNNTKSKLDLLLLTGYLLLVIGGILLLIYLILSIRK